MTVATVSPVAAPVLEGIDLTSINTIRTLSMDAVQAANSGHPGTPMAMAPVVYCLWCPASTILSPRIDSSKLLLRGGWLPH